MAKEVPIVLASGRRQGNVVRKTVSRLACDPFGTPCLLRLLTAGERPPRCGLNITQVGDARGVMIGRNLAFGTSKTTM